MNEIYERESQECFREGNKSSWGTPANTTRATLTSTEKGCVPFSVLISLLLDGRAMSIMVSDTLVMEV